MSDLTILPFHKGSSKNNTIVFFILLRIQFLYFLITYLYTHFNKMSAMLVLKFVFLLLIIKVLINILGEQRTVIA